MRIEQIYIPVPIHPYQAILKLDGNLWSLI